MRLPKEDLRIGKYQVLQRLASGGMGEVFLALQEGPAGFLRKVVVKRMHSPIGENPAFVEMFLNEARLAALLSHPNVVHILELGKAGDGSWFIAMEHIHGRSLREVLAARSRLGTQGLPPALAARLCADVLRGLHHAHEMRDAQGKRLEIIHRDVTPENVLVSFSGTVKVVDFGIAKAVSESTSITRVSQLKGKVPYLAPEQLLGEQVDARTDVYATGCVLYEMLSGQSAFVPAYPGADLIETVLASLSTPLGTLCPHLPAALGAITQRAMARSPADRFASAQEMATALEDFLQQTQVRVPPEEVSRFMAGLFGAAAVAPPQAVSGPHTSPGLTAALDSPLTPRPPEVTTEPDLTQHAVPFSAMSAPPAPRLLGPPPGIELRRVTAGAPPQFLEAPSDEFADVPTEVEGNPMPHPRPSPVEPPAKETVEPSAEFADVPTEVEGTPMPHPRPARVAPPTEGRRAQRPARRWLLPFVAAAALGLVLTMVGVGFLQPGAQPPAASSEQVPLQADSVQAGSRPPADATAQSPPDMNGKASASPKGWVILHVQPPAELFIGSQPMGETPSEPIEILLSAGQHTLTLKNAALGVTRQITVTVPAGGKVSLKEDLDSPAPKRP